MLNGILVNRAKKEKKMWNRSLLFCVNEAKKRGICFYGAGYWGNIAYRLFSLFDIEPLCYCEDDTSKIGKCINEVPVLSVREAAEQFPEAVYIVCIDITRTTGAYNRYSQKNMLENLKKYHVYDSNSELRLPFYVFLLDINGFEEVERCKEEANTIPINSRELFWWNNLKNLAVVSNMSNSGVWFFTQLLDMHSHILSLPFSETFENIYINRLQYLEGDELIIEMAAQMLGYFKSAFEELPCVGQNKFQSLCIDSNGENIKNAYIDPTDFLINLYSQFQGKKIKLHSYGQMLKMYFAVYNNCLNRSYDSNKNYWMIYDLHTPDYDMSKGSEYLFKEEFERIEHLMIIREPVQHCFSWVKRMVISEKNNAAVLKTYLLKVIRSELGLNIEKKEGIDIHVIKFEDVKFQGKLFLEALCQFLQIPFEESLMKTTLNGIEVYFPANTKEGVKYITGFDTAAASQKDFSEILSPWDEVRLNIIYSLFKDAMGYEVHYPSLCEFKEETLEDILREDFKFASVIQQMVDTGLKKEEQYDVNSFIKKLFIDYVKEHYNKKVIYYDYITSERK